MLDINATFALILVFLSGPVAVAITEIGKRLLLKLFPRLPKATVSYILCALTSVGGTLYILVSTATFSVVPFIGFSILVFIEASGLYKALPKSNMIVG